MITLSRLFFVLSLSLFAFFNAQITFAKPVTPITNPALVQNLASDSTFDAALANKILDQLNLNINSENINVKDLQTAVSNLSKFQMQAKKCINLNTTQLEKVNQRLKEISTLSLTPLQKKELNLLGLTDEEKYLKNKKNEISLQLSECRLFNLHSEDLTETLGKKLRELVATRLLYTHPNVLQNLHNLPTKIKKSWQSFNNKIFLNESGIAFFTTVNPSLFLLSFLMIGFTLYIYKQAKKKLKPLIGDKIETRFSAQVKQTIYAVLNKYLCFFSIGVTLTLVFSIFTHSLVTPSYLALISYAFVGYVIFLFLIRFFFSPPLPAQRFTSLSAAIAEILFKRLHRFATLSFFIYTIYIFLHHQKIEHSLVDLFHTIVITLMAINLISIIWIVKNSPKLDNRPKGQQKILRFFISFFSITLLFSILIAEYLGYHLLALYLLNGIVMTVFLLFFMKFLNQTLNTGLDTLKNTNQPWQKKLRSALGLKRYHTFPEIIWLRLLLYITIWLAFLIAILKIWGLAQTNFQNFLWRLLYGFDIGKLHIVPSRILGGILLFITLTLTTRWLRVYIIRNSRWRLENSSKESLASIAGYIGFAFAFLLGALVAGVNFSGLALIAGALSVGIGFGLQNIVNNFVSGIILLIERPIKLGDSIAVGETEGLVKQISIRSTRLLTSQYSDIIVPNSELISKQVTNYMLYDLKYKIWVAVGVAYGSDTRLVQEVLLDVAKAHPEIIIDDKGPGPIVYFRAFGESSLHFELHCVIKDVTFKTRVASDLNFAIEKAFREKNIEIAYPQRDIRITQWPKNDPA